MYYSYNDKGSSLKTGQYLQVNDGLTSPDGKYLLILGSDGNLGLNQLPGGTLWQSNTSGVSGQYFAIMQADGNFCIYMGSDPAHQGPFRWGTMASYRPGTGQYLALLQDNGNFTIYTQDAGQTKTGAALWSTDTAPWPRKWRPENWMGHLPGSKLLSQLTIPGTHDTGTYKGAGGVLAQCQTMSIADQLAAGIRSLDMRCGQIGNTFEIYHTVDQNVSFDDVYTACIQFLQANPGECILMGIGWAYDDINKKFVSINPIGSFEDVFNRYQQMHPDFWYLGDAIPTLDEVRGKIVLRRNFATVHPPKGIDATGGTLNATFDLQRTSTVPRPSTYTLHFQANYVVNTIFDIESHATTVTNFLGRAATATDDDWYINGASGTSGGAYPNAVALGVAGTSIGTNAHIAATLNNYAPDPFVRFGTVEMDFPDAGLIRQLIDLNGYSCLSIGGYDLRNSADQAFAFDYDGTGKLDHLVLYRPGQGIIYILKHSAGTQFSPVYASATGIGGYNLADSSDQAFAFDYDGSGKLDHLVFYRPGQGTVWILKNSAGQFSPVYQSGTGIGGYDQRSTNDRALAFDYDGTGKLDHLVFYRPGSGACFILKNSSGQFSAVYAQGDQGSGIGGYDLRSTNDRALAFDYDGTGKLDHLVFYRPGSGACCILKNSGGQFSGVYWQGDQGSGIGGYNLRSTADRAFALSYDYTGYLKYLVFYRPGTGTIWILQNTGVQFTPIYAQGEPGSGIGGYDLGDSSDRVFAFDYDHSGMLDHLVLYRPGKGIIYMVNQEQF
jgi:hypothetical protein